MKILKEMETGYGTGKWILADMGDEFYGPYRLQVHIWTSSQSVWIQSGSY